MHERYVTFIIFPPNLVCLISMSYNFGGMTDEKDNDYSTEKSCHGAVSSVLTVAGTGNAVM